MVSHAAYLASALAAQQHCPYLATSHKKHPTKNRQHILASAAVCLSTHLCYSFVSSSHDGTLNCYLYDGTCPCLMGVDLEEARLDVIHVVTLT